MGQEVCVCVYLTPLTCLVCSDWMPKTKPLKLFLTFYKEEKFWMTFKQHYQFLSNICIQVKKCNRSIIYKMLIKTKKILELGL